MIYKQDGDGKVFTDHGGCVTWIAEVTIDNAQEVINVLNYNYNKRKEQEKKIEKCYSEIAEAIQEIGDNQKVFYILNELIISI